MTVDPVLHAVANLSGLLKTTDGPLANVAKFRNYYESRGGYTHVEVYSMIGGMFQDQGQSSQIGNFFSSGITGGTLPKSASPGTKQTDITTDPAWVNKSIRRYFGQFSDGTEAYGKAKGSDIQHDTIIYYMHDQVVSDIQNG